MILGHVEMRVAYIFQTFVEVGLDIGIEISKISTLIVGVEGGLRLGVVRQTEVLGRILGPGQLKELGQHKVVVGTAEHGLAIEFLKVGCHGTSALLDCLKGLVGRADGEICTFPIVGE